MTLPTTVRTFTKPAVMLIAAAFALGACVTYDDGPRRGSHGFNQSKDWNDRNRYDRRGDRDNRYDRRSRYDRDGRRDDDGDRDRYDRDRRGG
jgi:hypothetical protein